MNDITALAKTLRLAAESEIAHRAECDTSDLWQDEASPENVLALVEALEARDKQIVFLKDQLAQLANFNPDWDRLKATTDSLREHMDVLKSAKSRIAEQESRTVTVKLPKRYSCEGYHIDEAYLQEDPEGDCYDRDEVLEALDAAGIQVIEGEG